MTSENHPCEILSDYFSLRSLGMNERKLQLTFVGPIGNILRSWMNLAAKMGLKLIHVCQYGERVMDDSSSYEFRTELEGALENCDVLLTDPLPAEYRNTSYLEEYQITKRHLEQLPNGSIFNPCPPFSRGEEVSDDALTSGAFVGYKFKRNLLYVHQAILRYCIGKSSTSSEAIGIPSSTEGDATPRLSGGRKAQLFDRPKARSACLQPDVRASTDRG